MHKTYLSTRGLIIPIAIAVTMTIAIGVTTYLVLAAQIEQNQQQMLKTTSVSIATLTKSFLDNVTSHLEKIAQSKAVEKYHQSHNKEALLEYLEKLSLDFDSISYINEQGVTEIQVAYQENPSEIDKPLDSASLTKRLATSNEITIGNPHYDPTQTRWLLDFYYHHVSYFDESLGILRATVSLSFLNETLIPVQLGQDGIIVVSTTDDLIVYNNQQQHLGSKLSSVINRNNKPSQENQTHLGRMDFLSCDCFVNAHSLPEYHWQIFTALPEQEYFKSINKLSLILSLGGILFVASTILLLYYAKAAQRIKREKDISEASNQMKSEFLANMSHELRTPLNAIIGYSELVSEELEELDYDQCNEDMQRIISSAKHLLALINKVLDLAKIEAGQADLHLESIHIRTLVEEVIDTIRPMANNANNQLLSNYSEDVDTMTTDLIKLRQILLNVASNANKFTENGSICLTVTAEMNQSQQWIIFSIIDTGIGIPLEKQAQVFQEFKQADSSTTRKYGGTGLGLSITQRFCEMLGGAIHLNSEPNKGTTMIIRLPASLEIEQQKAD